ncbi:pyridoxal phosphate-dependent decarboxylase family protein [Nocardioides bizhenqiangii]|uniref:Pyridoxal-dependent decarboxylase n=1 Tax=Nocardioides bizhenqiangii TaxID=3095076 RepID=A0ABZ0ZME3_9ACTN|nr:aminotransferase class V-fold PLP-dependent enzyme [Nocardioides sp. HM61]WQQ25101.1 pyridoxal-dependent decarboxylase [Nocardioides sp. HM61]
MPSSPLEISPDEFAELAGRVSAEVVRHLHGLDSAPIRPATTGAESMALFAGPAPEQGLGAAALDELSEVARHSRVGNGRFFGYVMGSGEPVAALGDFFASVLNQNATAWRSGPATAVIERSLIGWLTDALGCPGFSGTLTSGGSLANLMGLAMAREAKAPANETGRPTGVVYASSEVHMSVGKAVALLGLGRENLRLIPPDAAMRLDPGALRHAISADRAAGRTPIAVVANAGTIVTGAIDPLAAIVEVARAEDLWVHVDGAYGAPAAMVAPELFHGLGDVDSLSLDAHKWLYQPLDCSALLYRDPDAAQRAFSLTDDYAASLSADPVEGQVFFEETLELSRRVRALKLWLSLRYHGLEAFRDSIADNMRQARRLAALVDAEPTLERLAEVPLSAVCFRWVGGDPATLDVVNAAMLDRINRRGRVYLSNATVRGHFVLRACITNHRTTDADIVAVIGEVLRAAPPTGTRPSSS